MSNRWSARATVSDVWGAALLVMSTVFGAEANFDRSWYSLVYLTLCLAAFVLSILISRRDGRRSEFREQ